MVPGITRLAGVAGPDRLLPVEVLRLHIQPHAWPGFGLRIAALWGVRAQPLPYAAASRHVLGCQALSLPRRTWTPLTPSPGRSRTTRSCCPSSTRWAPSAPPSPSVAGLRPWARVAHHCLPPGPQSLDYDNSENQLFLEEERRINHTVSLRGSRGVGLRGSWGMSLRESWGRRARGEPVGDLGRGGSVSVCVCPSICLCETPPPPSVSFPPQPLLAFWGECCPRQGSGAHASVTLSPLRKWRPENQHPITPWLGVRPPGLHSL